MSVFNLGVVFGPTLLRPLEETVAAILDIKFNNIVINILIENYERIFKNDPSSAVTATAPGLHASSTSPPTRMPRASQVSKANSAVGSAGAGSGSGGTGGGGGGSVGRNSMYAQQQKVYRVVTKSNYTDPTMSSSLQNIPNGMIYAHGPASVTNSTPPDGGGAGGGGGGGVGNPSNTNGGISGSTLTVSSHATNGAARPAQMGSMKNLLTMTQSDIGGRRSGASSDAAAVYGILTGTSGPGGGAGVGSASTNGGGGGGGGGGGVALQAHHATPATAGNSSGGSLRHADYLMATATPVAQSASSSHIYTNAGSTRHSMNNVSPPTAAMRKERLLQSSGSSSAIVATGPQQHPPVQRSHFGYGQAKHYSPVAAASTSSSNESVCDSLSSNNGLGGGAGGAAVAGAGGGGGGGVGGGGVGGLISGGSSANVTRLLNARSSIDYPPITSQTSSLSTLLGSTCDDIVTATAAPSMIGGAGGIGSLSGSGSTNESADYAPTKMHRNRDINQIKRDLSAGTA